MYIYVHVVSVRILRCQAREINSIKHKRHLCDDWGGTHRIKRRVEKVDLEQAGIVKFGQKQKRYSKQQN